MFIEAFGCLSWFIGAKGIGLGISSLGSQRYIPGYAAMGQPRQELKPSPVTAFGRTGTQAVRVNTVCGGLIETDTLQYFPNPEILSLTKALTPLEIELTTRRCGKCGMVVDKA